MPKRIRRTFPVPEAIAPSGTGARGRKPSKVKPWQIEESKIAAVDLENRRMIVPLDESERSRFLRAHEQGHIRWTPKSAGCPDDVPMSAYQSAEDNRINYLLRNKAGISPERPLVDSRGHERFAEDWAAGRISDLEIASLLMASRGTPDHDALRGRLYDALTLDEYGEMESGALDSLCAAVNRLAKKNAEHCRTRGNPQYSETVEVARMMRDTFSADVSSADSPVMTSPGLETVERDLGGLSESDGTVSRALADAAEGAEYSDYAGSDTNSWVPMEVVKQPLAESFPARMKGPKPRPTDEGSVFGHPHRILTDGRVFRTKPRRKGTGTVLIDVSGSMSLSAEDVREIVGALPASTVAIYSGGHHPGTDEEVGILRIIAAGGRRARPEGMTNGPSMGGNMCDGPALKWLAKMPAPRIWICDGVVTGYGDMSAANLSREAGIIAKQAGIMRLPTMTEALEFVKRMGGGW